MTDFHNSPPKMDRLRLYTITKESTETEDNLSSLNGKVLWLLNSGYVLNAENAT